MFSSEIEYIMDQDIDKCHPVLNTLFLAETGLICLGCKYVIGLKHLKMEVLDVIVMDRLDHIGEFLDGLSPAQKLQVICL